MCVYSACEYEMVPGQTEKVPGILLEVLSQCFLYFKHTHCSTGQRRFQYSYATEMDWISKDSVVLYIL